MKQCSNISKILSQKILDWFNTFLFLQININRATNEYANN